jgi:mono/diheme cytochrome c family protein
MRSWRGAMGGAILAAVASGPAPAAAAGATVLAPSYDGHFAAVRPRAAGLVVAVFTQTSHAVKGTVTITLDEPELSGDYAVTGRAQGRRVTLAGRGAGKRSLRWSGRLVDATQLRGRAVLRAPHRRRQGFLVLVRRIAGGDACDAYFRDAVMARVLAPVCANCHVAGGLAQGTRLRVTLDDLVATRASVDRVIDLARPADSLLLHKPLGELGHGGGTQLARGGEQIGILGHWVDLMAEGGCVSGGGPTGGGGDASGAGLYAARCASCHGDDARGLPGRPNVRCNPGIRDTVRLGRRGPLGDMPPFPDLSDAAIAGIQQYLDGLCEAGGASGSDVYAGTCARCHGADATGTVSGPNVRCATRVEDAVLYGRGQVMPSFAFGATRLGALVTYLDALCTAAGATGGDLYAGNCASCHGATAAGGQNANGVRGEGIRCASANDLAEKIMFGEERMPAFPRLATNARVLAIASYLGAIGPCTGGGD